MECTIGFNECFLGYVFRFMRVPDKTPYETQQSVLIPQDQQVKGMFLAFENPLYQLFVCIFTTCSCQFSGSNLPASTATSILSVQVDSANSFKFLWIVAYKVECWPAF